MINPDRSSKAGALLGRLYTDQFMQKLAADQLRVSWTEAQGKLRGIIPDDETLRTQLPPGQHVMAESDNFVLLTTVAAGHFTFSLPEFLHQLQVRHRIPMDKLMTLVKECQVPTAKPLTKRVLPR